MPTAPLPQLEVELSKLNEQHAELQVKASAAVERGDAATATAEVGQQFT